MPNPFPPESPSGSGSKPGPDRAGEPAGEVRQERQIEQLLDVYTQLFQAAYREPTPATGSTPVVPRSPRHDTRPAPTAPVAPQTLAQCGLSLMQVCDLILKQLYLQGAALGVDLARQSRLPFNVIDEGIVFLKDEKCIEVSSGDLIGRVSYRFNLTDLGRARAREAFEQCRYV